MNWQNKSIMPAPRPIITLTTDFGLSDGYVAAIKGVILSRTPEATIVDLCHAIAPQDIVQAAYIIKDTFSSFPIGAIHVVVVDPGVGSDRGIILLAAHGHYFLAPDNGVLGLLIDAEAKAFLAQRPDLYQQPVSCTFHGRDIMAPLAAHLAAGHPPESIGQTLALEKLTVLSLPVPTIDRSCGRISGCIIRIDHFGNLITNISRADVQQLAASPALISLSIGQHSITSWHENYSQAAPGQALILINSSGLIEVAINQGHAANSLACKINDNVILSVC